MQFFKELFINNDSANRDEKRLFLCRRLTIELPACILTWLSDGWPELANRLLRFCWMNMGKSVSSAEPPADPRAGKTHDGHEISPAPLFESKRRLRRPSISSSRHDGKWMATLSSRSIPSASNDAIPSYLSERPFHHDDDHDEDEDWDDTSLSIGRSAVYELRGEGQWGEWVPCAAAVPQSSLGVVSAGTSQFTPRKKKFSD